MTTTLEHPQTTTTSTTAAQPASLSVSGIFDADPHDNHGFLRVSGYLPGPRDLYLPPALIRRYDLRPGDLIEGTAASRPAASQPGSSQPASSGSARQTKAQPLDRVDRINGRPADQQRSARPRFNELTPLHPQQRLRLETAAPGTRIIDLIAPIGKGQRGLIVAPPKTGKTLLLQGIAKALGRNHPECHLMMLLLDERPEEVTDMRRSVDAEVIASTFDRPAREHVALAALAIERAKRLAEQGTDVVILLDSLTRLCRAHNNNAKAGGRVLSGGVDAAAVSGPKQLFGAARNLEDAGSITILATALIDTGSRADDYFFEELKSTGNMEVRLDRALADKRVFPAIDIAGSGTRRDELLMSPAELEAVRRLRRALSTQSGAQGTELLLGWLKQSNTNAELLHRIWSTTPATP
jgi:transcription termination factor Rho